MSQWSNGIPPTAPAETDSTPDAPSSSFDAGADFVPFTGGTTTEATDPVLSPQQSEILKRIIDGENYFFTGSAGTGKSVLLRAIIKAFREREQEDLRNAPGLIEKLWQEYISSGGKSKAPGTEKVSRWKLGITASTGMAGV
jgi:Cdc6-like AAA superfamily ATPase